ncbi:MAG: diguanylate cyclase [Lachnospiraceae bacterium]|nr:diguanylate cyclase [Lachnospiraceae bacterium]
MKTWIVIVDDEPYSLTSARSLLAAENMRVSCLTCGMDLLKFMKINRPDLILLDVMMPQMDGFETLTRLREQEKADNRSEIPVIFLTGENDSVAERRGLKLGASDYIHKPFNKDILLSRISNIINNSKRIESLTNDATIDKLTGFFNKSEGVSRVTENLLISSGALLILDLDNFKLVNDLFGHEKGDLILKSFADIAKNITEDGDILCRIGGDEFLFFCLSLLNEDSLSAFTLSLNKRLEEEALLLLGPDHGIPLGVSVGAVMVPEYGTDYDKLFKMADEAMYKTKQKGRHGFTVFTDSEPAYEIDQNPDKVLLRLTKIIEERNEGREALLLGKGEFSIIFRFLERFKSSYDLKNVLLLFIVVPGKNMDAKTANDTFASFGRVLQKTLGKSDLIMQNKNNQFLVLLPMMDISDADNIYKRIMAAWKEIPESIDFEIKTSLQQR